MPLKIIRQNITAVQCDAIVNATNERLFPEGEGVDAAIHSAAGKGLIEACKYIGGVSVGNAVITDAFELPCKFVIHTAGPVWKGGEYREQELLESCYISSLTLAAENGCESVAIPLISSGAYGYPKDKVLKVAMNAISEFLLAHEMTVYLTVYDKTSYEFSRKLFSDIVSYIDGWGGESACASLESDDYVLRRRVSFNQNLESFDESYKRIAHREDDSEGHHFRKSEVHSRRIMPPVSSPSVRDQLRAMDKGFAELLFELIDRSGMTDVECYKRANVDRKTFSKIKCNKNYRPSKATALSFAVALRLDIRETNHLLETLGMTLSRSIAFDVIVQYFIVHKIYDINVINEALFEFDQNLLGC